MIERFPGPNRGIGSVRDLRPAVVCRRSATDVRRPAMDAHWGACDFDAAHQSENDSRPAMTALLQPYDRRRQNRILDVLALMRPLAMRSQQKIRIGNDCDGGYVVPARALDCDAVISIGVGPDVSFDFVLAERGARIIQFDHTVDGPPVDHPAFRFFNQGWGARTEGEFLSLRDIDARLEGEPQHKLLKFDIEGGEYDIFEALVADDLRSYEVICCELHHFAKLADEAFFAKIRHLLECLTHHHAPIHLHANNYGNFILIEGVPIPEVLELTLLRRDLDSFDGYSREPIPGPMDRPNHPLRPDLCMTAF
ncbi:MAG: FkbM family methyltransferase [Burkholderiaceae bacterium]